EEMQNDPLANGPTRGLARLVERPPTGTEVTTEWLVGCLVRVWPNDTDAVLAAAARAMVKRFEEPDVGYAPFHAWLEPLTDPFRPWTEMACLAVAVALSQKAGRPRAAAVDGLILAIDDGRVDEGELGTVLARVLEGGWAALGRPTAAFAEVVAVSPRHEDAVARILDAMFGYWGQDAAKVALPPVRGLPALLELFHPLLRSRGRVVSEPARRALGAVAGRGKAAKLARAILARGREE
ncbi:MAG: DUF6493 family protein, partial [Holophagales bacterium]|nr:DUF6493 family protein [Holophagales bacterium]